jgi:protein gp37
MRVPGKRFVSVEPMLGPVSFFPSNAMWTDTGGVESMLHAVLLGGESGKNSRPMELGWAISIAEQCRAAGVPFFMKQMGTAWAKKNGLGGKGTDVADLPLELRARELPYE